MADRQKGNSNTVRMHSQLHGKNVVQRQLESKICCHFFYQTQPKCIFLLFFPISVCTH